MSLFILLIALTRVVIALNPGCHPGGNFDLSKWSLQLPTGIPGHPDTISSSSLQGCDGYSSNFFFTDGNGQLVMTVPGSPASSGCVTTPNSLHCRTEFRESNPSSWSPLSGGTNRLKASLSVPEPDNSGHGTVIGQVHIDDSISSKPVCELYYSSSGLISMGVEFTRAGGDLRFTNLGTVSVGSTFTYEIRYEGGQLSVAINSGVLVSLDQFQLDNPSSYFKVGNYNQGDSPSEVHIQSISVTHGTADSSPTGTAVSTVVKGGIGPHQTIYLLDHIIVPPPPFPSPVGACDAAPTTFSDGTVNLQFYYENNCCHAVETAHLGTFNVCHNTNGPFSSIEQAAGANLFDRGIHVVGYQDANCNGGSSAELSLSNSKGCQAISSSNAGYQSFMVIEPPTCAVTAPSTQSDNTVTLELNSDFGCCSSVESIKLGTKGVCHNANQDFHSFSQSVGSNMFGWNIHVHTYEQAGCQGDRDSVSLTNAGTCNKNGIAWKSFQLEQECQKIIPDNSGDFTVALALYRDSGCCVPTNEGIVLGTLGSCHNANRRFGSLTQRVGKQMFGQGIQVEFFTDSDCKGTSTKRNLSNDPPNCSASGIDEAFASFQLSLPPPPQCEWQIPSNSNANTVTVYMYNDFQCCDFNKQTVAGVIDTCHNTTSNPTGGILALGVDRGSSWDGAQIEVFIGDDCTGDARFATLTSTLSGICLTSGLGTISSFKLIRAAAPPTATIPTPVPPPQTTSAPQPTHPSVCPDNWIGVGYSQECGIINGCEGNFGAIYFNGCKNTHLGGDSTWCKGPWVSGWNVQCDSAGAPSEVTTPNGNFGSCFQLERDCEVSFGIASEFNYQWYCCSPL